MCQADALTADKSERLFAWDTGEMATRDEVHRLVDVLPEDRVAAIGAVLRAAIEAGMTDEQAHRLAEQLAFLSDVRAGRYTLIESLSANLERIAELVAKYDDLPLGTVDASVIALAERLNITTVVTIDRRDFGIVRPAHVPALTLLP